MPCKKKAVPISIPYLSHVNNVIYLLVFVKFFYDLSFALITWLHVSWFYLPSVQGSKYHDESREMSPDQFLSFNTHPGKETEKLQPGNNKNPFH